MRHVLAATVWRMSKDAIQTVVRELEALTESDQRLVLEFLATLKRHRNGKDTPLSIAKDSPALALKDGLLVFTGELECPDTDWVQLARDERDQAVMQAAPTRRVA